MGASRRRRAGLAYPYDGNKATVGNGVMVALAVDSRESRSPLRKALELGAPTKARPARAARFYAGYFRDLDGNKLLFCMA